MGLYLIHVSTCPYIPATDTYFSTEPTQIGQIFLENTVIKQSKLLTNVNNKSRLIEPLPIVLKENHFQIDSIGF